MARDLIFYRSLRYVNEVTHDVHSNGHIEQ